MRWSLKLGRFAGIDAYVHASFLLLVAWAAWAAYQGAGSGLAAVLGVVFLLGVFGSVLLHEFGHALTAGRFGIQTLRIVLWPVGGVAQLEDDPRTPRQELLVALAGPAVNFALASALFVVTRGLGLDFYGLLHSLMVANLTVGAFNLIPAFPMDGGRMFRALLATRLGGRRATDLAVMVGQWSAAGFAVTGLFGNKMLVLVGAFVWVAASAEGGRDPYGPNRYAFRLEPRWQRALRAYCIAAYRELRRIASSRSVPGRRPVCVPPPTWVDPHGRVYAPIRQHTQPVVVSFDRY